MVDTADCVTSIGVGVFQNQAGYLYYVDLPVCTTIGANAFDTATPAGGSSAAIFLFPLVTSVGNNCFDSCEGLAATGGSQATLDLSACTALGDTTGAEGVFAGMGSAISPGNYACAVTIPTATQSDADFQGWDTRVTLTITST